MFQKGQGLVEYVLFAFIALLVLVAVSGYVPSRAVVMTVNGVVVDKYVATDDNTSKYYVAVKTDSGVETFKEDDSIWWLKFNSADVYQSLQLGKSYQLTVTGWRFPLLSWFRNIVRVDPAP